MKKVITSIIIIIALLAGGWYLSQRQPAKQATIDTTKQTAYASFYPLSFFAQEIGGEKVTVYNLTPAGTEPHEYDPSLQDIANIEASDFLILNGGVESWGNKIKKNLTEKDVTVISAGDGLFTIASSKDHADPHIWIDPVLAKEQVTNITNGFIARDSTNARYYQANKAKLLDRLDALDNTYREGLATCKQQEFVTSHAAFAYLAKRYGLTQVAIAGFSPEEEPSLQQLAEITEFAKEHNVKYIFFETLVSPKLSETIASEIGAETLVLDPIEGISEDDRVQGKNYFTVMEENLKNLRTALKCE